jgi:hypothetical protein
MATNVAPLVTATYTPTIIVPDNLEVLTHVGLRDALIPIANRAEFLRVNMPTQGDAASVSNIFCDDFMLSQLDDAFFITAENNWSADFLGPPSILPTTVRDIKHPGITRIICTANQAGRIYIPSAIALQDVLDAELIFRVTTSDLTGFRLSFGFGAVLPALGSDGHLTNTGAAIVKTIGSSTLSSQTRNEAATVTTKALGAVNNNVWQRLRIVRSATGALNYSNVATASGLNVAQNHTVGESPAGSSLIVNFGFFIYFGSQTPTTTFDFDRVQFRTVAPGDRTA